MHTETYAMEYKGKLSSDRKQATQHLIFDMSHKPGSGVQGETAEYAVALGSLLTSGGSNLGAVSFVRVVRNAAGMFMLVEIPGESYLYGKSIYCVNHVSTSRVIACCAGEPTFHVINRDA